MVAGLQEEVRRLARERRAVIIAHNYQVPEVQDVADFVGDSLGLSRQAAAADAEVIAFCGVHFMAETAALLSPQRTVLLPDLKREELRFVDRASRRELGRLSFPGGAPQGITITPDGRYAFESMSGQARVAIIEVGARTVVGYLAAGETPDGIGYTTRVMDR